MKFIHKIGIAVIAAPSLLMAYMAFRLFLEVK